MHTVLVGKKNLEVRPIAVNKGEIVRRILYNNPDAEFVFCAGDDKTDEDMFRALAFSETELPLVMEPPISVTTLKDPSILTHHKEEEVEWKARTLALVPDAIFTTAVGHPSKRTLARWHVTTPMEVIEELTQLAEGDEEKARECVEGKVVRDGELKEEEEKEAEKEAEMQHQKEEAEAKL